MRAAVAPSISKPSMSVRTRSRGLSHSESHDVRAARRPSIETTCINCPSSPATGTGVMATPSRRSATIQASSEAMAVSSDSPAGERERPFPSGCAILDTKGRVLDTLNS